MTAFFQNHKVSTNLGRRDFLGKILSCCKPHLLFGTYLPSLLAPEQGLHSVQHLVHYQHLINAEYCDN